MLAHACRGVNPRDGWQGAIAGSSVEVVDGNDVAELPVLRNGLEVRQGVPDRGSPQAPGGSQGARDQIRLARPLAPVADVVTPAHSLPVEQLRDVRPGKRRGRRATALLVPGSVEIGPAAHGIVAGAVRRPG